MTARTRALWIVLMAVGAVPAAATQLTFEQALGRALELRQISPRAADALRVLENPPPFRIPVVRAETVVNRSETLDIITGQGPLRFQTYSALVSVDYPLRDAQESIRREIGRIDAAAFRGALRGDIASTFRQTLDAYARAYIAQERVRIYRTALERATQRRDRAEILLAEQQITNLTAAVWQDAALFAESQLLSAEAEYLDAAASLARLAGLPSAEELELSIAFDQPPSLRLEDETAAGTLAWERRKLVLQEAEASRRPQIFLSGFGGVAAVPSGNDDQMFGIYGLRLSLTLPMFDRALQRRVAEARLQAEEAEWQAAQLRRIEEDARASGRRSFETVQRRIPLLVRSVEVARSREESMARLIAGGLRTDADAADAAADRVRREVDLLSARVDLWKLERLMLERGEAPPPAAPATRTDE